MFLLSAIFGNIGGQDEAVDEAVESSRQSANVEIAATTDKSKDESEAAPADEGPAEPSEEEYLALVRAAADAGLGEGDAIEGVTLDDRDLRVTVKIANNTKLADEDIAIGRVSSITDEILEIDEAYDVLWDTITIDFGDLGYATNGKDKLESNEYGRYFADNRAHLDGSRTGSSQ